MSAEYLDKKRTSVRELTETKIQCAALEGDILATKDCDTFETRSDDMEHPCSFDVEKSAMESFGESLLRRTTPRTLQRMCHRLQRKLVTLRVVRPAARIDRHPQHAEEERCCVWK